MKRVLFALLALSVVVGCGGKSKIEKSSITEAKVEVEAVDLGLPSGTKWASCNVGATSPEDYGNYYAWGEITTKYVYNVESSKTLGMSMFDISGNKDYDAATANWGKRWRMPTKEEFDELRNNCTWTWITQNNVKGYKVTSKKNGNSIFLPAAGYCLGRGTNGEGLRGYYSSSTPHEDYRAYHLDFSVDRYGTGDYGLYEGRSVRPVLAE